MLSSHRLGQVLSRWWLFLPLLLVIALSVPDEAIAHGGPAVNTNCGQIYASGQPAGGIITRAVLCMRRAVSAATTDIHEELAHFMWPATLAVTTLLVMFFGIKLMSGYVQNLTAESSMLGLKVAVVLYLSLNFADYYPAFFSAIDMINEVVASDLAAVGCSTPTGTTALTYSNGSPFEIEIGNTTQYLTARDAIIWLKLDCVFDRFFSLKTAAIGGLGLIAVFATILFTGILGLIVLVAAISAALSFIFLVVRSILMLMMSYITIGLLVIISPLIIPCLYFKETTSFFMKWIGQILAAIIQPMFMLAFMGFAAIVIVSLSYSGTYITVMAPPENAAVFADMGGEDGFYTVVSTTPVAVTGTEIRLWPETGMVKPLSEIPKLWPIQFKPKKIEFLHLVGDRETYAKVLAKILGYTPGSPESQSFFSGVVNSVKGFAVNIGGRALELATIPFSISFSIQVPQIADEIESLRMLLMTLLTMTLIAVLMLKLLWVIPQMAHRITGAAGLALMQASAGALPLPSLTFGGIREVNLEAAALGGLSAAENRMRRVLRVRKTTTGQSVKRGAAGALAGAYAGYKAGYARSGVGGGIRMMTTGALSGGLRGARQGAKQGAKSNFKHSLLGAVRSIPAAVLGGFRAGWTKHND